MFLCCVCRSNKGGYWIWEPPADSYFNLQCFFDMWTFYDIRWNGIWWVIVCSLKFFFLALSSFVNLDTGKFIQQYWVINILMTMQMQIAQPLNFGMTKMVKSWGMYVNIFINFSLNYLFSRQCSPVMFLDSWSFLHLLIEIFAG